MKKIFVVLAFIGFCLAAINVKAQSTATPASPVSTDSGRQGHGHQDRSHTGEHHKKGIHFFHQNHKHHDHGKHDGKRKGYGKNEDHNKGERKDQNGPKNK